MIDRIKEMHVLKSLRDGVELPLIISAHAVSRDMVYRVARNYDVEVTGARGVMIPRDSILHRTQANTRKAKSKLPVKELMMLGVED